MDRIRIRGGRRLQGTIAVGGAKNAALPLLATALLTGDGVTLTNTPALSDVVTMAALLEQHGLRVEHDRASQSIRLEGEAKSKRGPSKPKLQKRSRKVG